MAGRKITKEGAKELEALQEMLRTEAEAPEAGMETGGVEPYVPEVRETETKPVKKRAAGKKAGEDKEGQNKAGQNKPGQNKPEEQEILSVEESFRRLDEITGRMEREEITLEESFRLFQEGMELVKRCGGQLADVEKKMILLEEEYQG